MIERKSSAVRRRLVGGFAAAIPIFYRKLNVPASRNGRPFPRSEGHRCHLTKHSPGFRPCVNIRLEGMRRGLVPEGLDDSSPVRSAGKMMQKTRPSRQGRSKRSAFGPRNSASQSSDRSSRPDGCLIKTFPSTSYWATFVESLRDKSSSNSPKSHVVAPRLSPGLSAAISYLLVGVPEDDEFFC